MQIVENIDLDGVYAVVPPAGNYSIEHELALSERS
jgi:hypothetical protein